MIRALYNLAWILVGVAIAAIAIGFAEYSTRSRFQGTVLGLSVAKKFF